MLGVSVGGGQQHSYSVKVFIGFVALGLPFPHVHLFEGGGGQQASSLSSKHKLWNFHRFWLVIVIAGGNGGRMAIIHLNMF